MGKSKWLLSAALVAIASPAIGQTAVSNTDTDKASAQPTPGATEGAAKASQSQASSRSREGTALR